MVPQAEMCQKQVLYVKSHNIYFLRQNIWKDDAIFLALIMIISTITHKW